MNTYIKEFLNNNIDLEYKKFSYSLLPLDTNILGVRLPVLRKLSKKIIDYRSYLDNALDDSFEEIMLQGMVIGNLDMSFDELVYYIDRFVPKINNWSICDSFVSSLKITNKYKDLMFEYLKKYINSDCYEVRFMLVMFINYYIDLDYLERIFNTISLISNNDYYVKMAIAWLLSICYIKYDFYTLNYLKTCNLDKFTYNKTIQKIIESKRVSSDVKNMLRGMKR